MPEPLIQPQQAHKNAASTPWPIVVLHQTAREVAYLALGLRHAISKCVGSTRSNKPTMIDGPDEAATNRVCSSSSAKTVLFIRHGQGDHNVTIKNWKLIDPHLNATGQQQAKELAKRLGGAAGPLRSVELVVTSPLTRAMQTAQAAFEGVETRWAVSALLRERMGAPCDEGLKASELLAQNPHMKTWEGADELEEVWWTPGMEWHLFSRVAQLEEWVASRPESTIALVGHGGLFTRVLGYHLHNCGHQWVSWELGGGGK